MTDNLYIVERFMDKISCKSPKSFNASSTRFGASFDSREEAERYIIDRACSGVTMAEVGLLKAQARLKKCMKKFSHDSWHSTPSVETAPQHDHVYIGKCWCGETSKPNESPEAISAHLKANTKPSVETPEPEPTYCEGCEKHLDRIFGNNEWIHVENYGGGTSECLNPPTPASMQDVPTKDTGTLADLALFLDSLLALMQSGHEPHSLAELRSRL